MSNAKPTPNPSQIRSSDAAQAVLNAYENVPQTGFCLGEQKALAAALRALADQPIMWINKDYILAIATELEGANG